MSLFFNVLEIIGTVAFAISGALEGIRHRMDIFGAVILGIITAVGGGICRDLVIGCTPPRSFSEPACAIISVIAALATFVVAYIIHGRVGVSKRTLTLAGLLYFAADTAGLAAFTVLGMESASAYGVDSAACLLCVGVLTGTGGGVLRDVLSGTVPAIFRRQIYALASVAGAAMWLVVSRCGSPEGAMTAGFLVVCAIRIPAAKFKWNLPRIGRNTAQQ